MPRTAIFLVIPPSQSLTKSTPLATTSTTTTPLKTSPTTASRMSPSQTSTTITATGYPEYQPDLENAVFVLEMKFVFDGNFDDIVNNGLADEVKHFYEQKLKDLFGMTNALQSLTVEQIVEGSVILIVETQFSVTGISTENTTLSIIVETAITFVEDGDIDLNFTSMTIDVSTTVQILDKVASTAEGFTDCEAVGICPTGYECIYRSLADPTPVCVHKCTLYSTCGLRAECYYDDLRDVTDCRCKDTGHTIVVGSACAEEEEDTDLTGGVIAGIVIGVLSFIVGCCGLVIGIIKMHNTHKSWSPLDWCK